MDHLDDDLAARPATVTALVGDEPDEVETVLALADGLVLAVCFSALPVVTARSLLAHHLATTSRAGPPTTP